MNLAINAEPSRPSRKRSWRIALQRFVFARTSLEAQLYPPLKRKILFRLYEERDFEPCLAIYRKNEAGRFPPDHEPKFAEYLNKDQKMLIVAECGSRVAGYGGISLLAPNAAFLCYGIVDPEFQGQRIGSTLTLLRIAQLPAEPSGVFAVIFAVEAAMPIHRRFGFIERARWKAGDGKEHPVGLLQVPLASLSRVKSALNRRRLQIQGNVVLRPSEEISSEILRDTVGFYRLLIRLRAQGNSPSAVTQ